LTPIETAEGLERLRQLSGCTHSELAKRVGLSNATVTRLLALLELPTEIRDQIHAGRIPASAGYKLSQVADRDRQAALASQVASGDLTRDAVTACEKPKRIPRPVAFVDAKLTIQTTGMRIHPPSCLKLLRMAVEVPRVGERPSTRVRDQTEIRRLDTPASSTCDDKTCIDIGGSRNG
jgi:transcriptional regulator with XRE-family HTH domain